MFGRASGNSAMASGPPAAWERCRRQFQQVPVDEPLRHMRYPFSRSDGPAGR